MSEDLARKKQDKIQGGDVNYYLVIITLPNGREITVEIEDVIEALNMNFSAGTVFKSLVRLTKLRMDLGKPGSNAVYESQKVLYSAKRTLVMSQRRAKLIRNAFVNVIDYVTLRQRTYYNSLDAVINIPDPKRLQPYSFKVDDFVKALNPTNVEYVLLHDILTIAAIRNDRKYFQSEEIIYANELLYHAEDLERSHKV